MQANTQFLNQVTAVLLFKRCHWNWKLEQQVDVLGGTRHCHMKQIDAQKMERTDGESDMMYKAEVVTKTEYKEDQ